eukprot:g5240.t1
MNTASLLQNDSLQEPGRLPPSASGAAPPGGAGAPPPQHRMEMQRPPLGGGVAVRGLPDKRRNLCADCCCSRRCCMMTKFRFLIMRKRWLKTLLSVLVTPLMILILVAIKAGTTDPNCDPVHVKALYNVTSQSSKLTTRIWTLDDMPKEKTLCASSQIHTISDMARSIAPLSITAANCSAACLPAAVQKPLNVTIDPRCSGFFANHTSAKSDVCDCLLITLPQYFVRFIEHGGTNFLLRCNVSSLSDQIGSFTGGGSSSSPSSSSSSSSSKNASTCPGNNDNGGSTDSGSTGASGAAAGLSGGLSGFNLTPEFIDALGAMTDKCETMKLVVTHSAGASAATVNKSLAFANFLNATFGAEYPSLAWALKPWRHFADAKAVEDYWSSKDYGVGDNYKIGAAIEFEEWDVGGSSSNTADNNDRTSAVPGGQVSYKIRMNETAANLLGIVGKQNFPKTNKYLDTAARGSTDYAAEYSDSGFLALQLLMDNWIIATLRQDYGPAGGNAAPTKADVAGPGLIGVPAAVAEPTQYYEYDSFWTSFGGVLGLFMVVAYQYPISFLATNLVYERERKLRQSLVVMSLPSIVIDLTWLLVYLIIFTTISILATLVGGTLLFTYTSNTVMFIAFFFFGTAVTAFVFFLTALPFSFVHRANYAMIFAMSLFFLGYLFLSSEKPTDVDTLAARKAATALPWPSAAFIFILLSSAHFESIMAPLDFAAVRAQAPGSAPVGVGIALLVVQTIIYTLLGLFLNHLQASNPNVVIRSCRCSCLTGLFDCGGGGKNKNKKGRSRSRAASAKMGGFGGGPAAAGAGAGAADGAGLEGGGMVVAEGIGQAQQELAGQGRAIDINGLVKVFQTANGPKTAVNGLQLQMFEGQITALLGHNGAGKTTTINMLCGLEKPTQGQASVFGFNVNGNRASIRSYLGVCPQHDILWPDVTVFQHLQLFAVIKGVPPSRVTGECDKFIAEVGLTEKRDVAAGTLSGGQRRKLSLAIALVGDSKVVVLDEPTSGMDPYSRRFTRDVIQKHREGRIVVLTTHFM